MCGIPTNYLFYLAMYLWMFSNGMYDESMRYHTECNVTQQSFTPVSDTSSEFVCVKNVVIKYR
jgi:hypothetical protein